MTSKAVLLSAQSLPEKVRVGGRVKSKASIEALKPQMETFATHMSATASSMIPVDGKVKFPKRKKILSAEQEAEKQVVTFFKKLLAFNIMSPCPCLLP